MEKTITVSGKDFPVSLHKATVIHADKFTRTSGGWNNLPVTSTLYTDVVFRIDESNEDWPLYIKNIDHRQGKQLIVTWKATGKII